MNKPQSFNEILLQLIIDWFSATSFNNENTRMTAQDLDTMMLYAEEIHNQEKGARQ